MHLATNTAPSPYSRNDFQNNLDPVHPQSEATLVSLMNGSCLYSPALKAGAEGHGLGSTESESASVSGHLWGHLLASRTQRSCFTGGALRPDIGGGGDLLLSHGEGGHSWGQIQGLRIPLQDSPPHAMPGSWREQEGMGSGG